MQTPSFATSASSRLQLHNYGLRSTSVRPILYRASPRMGLSVKTETLPKSQIGLEISVEASDCQAAWNSAIREISKKVTVDGFRKGKVPKKIIETQYNPTLRATACENLIEKSIQKALKEVEVNAIGQAQFTPDSAVEDMLLKFDPHSDFTFKVTVDVWPETKFTESYENLKIEAEEVPFDDSLVDDALEELRKKESFSVLAGEDATAEIGKLCVVDLVGWYENEDGSKGDELPDIADGKSIEVTLEEGKFFPGFVEGLIGAKAGEQRTVNITFPANAPRAELAGRKAIFDVTVSAIKDMMLPEIDDIFVQRVSECLTVEELRNQIKDRLDTESERAQTSNINKAIEDRLAEIVSVELPETLVENQVQKNFANMMAGFQSNGMSREQVKAMVTKENYELYKQRGKSKAEKGLSVSFAVSQIVKEMGLELNPEEIEGQMSLARAEVKGEEIDEAKLKDQIESQLERDLVLAKLKETATITIVPKKEEEETKAEKKDVESPAPAPAPATAAQ